MQYAKLLLRLPTTVVVHSEYVFDFVRNFNLGIVTDELAHSSSESDAIFQGLDKLPGRLHGVDIRDQRVFANEDLGHCDARVNGWSIREAVSEATASILLGMLNAGNAVNCFFVGNLEDVTAP